MGLIRWERDVDSVRRFYYEHWTMCDHVAAHLGSCSESVGLYEGQSVRPGRRQVEHGEEKAYWVRPLVIAVSPFELGTTDEEVRRFERESIGRRRWPFNDRHNPDHDGQELVRAEILSAVVPVRARWAWLGLRVRRWVQRLWWAVAWLMTAGVGAVLLDHWLTP